MKQTVIEQLLLEEYRILEATYSKIEFLEKELEIEKKRNKNIFERMMKK